MIDIKKSVPKHIAIIMDGNGRWAKQRGEERLYGHMAGVKSVRRVIERCLDLGIDYLTLYAFSTENWGRPTDEVNGLMTLFCQTIAEQIGDLIEQGVRVSFMGRRDRLGDEVKENIYIAEELTKENKELRLIIALDYSAKEEIIFATQKIAQKVAQGEINIEDITDETINNNLYLDGIPDPDLMIRTSGECRISNFMLWQLAYSEFYFTDILWPDFGGEELEIAIESYCERDRRFGKINKNDNI